MAIKTRRAYRCTACDAAASQWTGRCPHCGGWNTVEEAPASLATVSRFETARPVVLADVDIGEHQPHPTGVVELDRVLGGGLVPGSVTLLGGEPGTGKSTLVVQALAAMADAGMRCLLVSAEESAHQVRLRAERLGALGPDLWLMSETSLPAVIAAVDEVEPAALVVDSIQTIHDPDADGVPGSVVQVRECAHRLVRLAKARSLTTILVGHVTKDGALAGPRLLEHLVDTVLSFEGDRHHALRVLRAAKHRFGSTAELGLFEMAGDGLWGVPDAAALFLADRRPGVAGSVVAASVDGHRPLLVEIQALVLGERPSNTAVPPRRSAQGIDTGRLGLVLAVLERHARCRVGNRDVYASAAGGVRLADPGLDLAVALAVASSVQDRPMPSDVVACGEIGLGGELRQAPQTARRLAEAARMGFRQAIVPHSAPDPPPGMTLLRAPTLERAITVGLARGVQ